MNRRVILSFVCAAVLAASCAFSADTCREVEIDGAVGKLRGDLYVPQNATVEGKVPAVILCPGLTASRGDSLFNGIASSVQRAGMACVKFDFNGHGESDGKLTDMTVLNEKEDLEKIYEYVRTLDFVDESRIAVLGHSQGGAVAGLFAAEHPELAAMVLCASASISIQNAVRTGEFLYTKFDPENLPDSIPSFGDKYLGKRYFEDLRGVDLTEALAKYNGPACIVNGVWDKLVPVSDSQIYHELMPQSELHILDSLGHSYHQNPGKVIDLCTDFLERTLL